MPFYNDIVNVNHIAIRTPTNVAYVRSRSTPVNRTPVSGRKNRQSKKKIVSLQYCRNPAGSVAVARLSLCPAPRVPPKRGPFVASFLYKGCFSFFALFNVTPPMTPMSSTNERTNVAPSDAKTGDLNIDS
jgi:hypothetical protein